MLQTERKMLKLDMSYNNLGAKSLKLMNKFFEPLIFCSKLKQIHTLNLEKTQLDSDCVESLVEFIKNLHSLLILNLALNHLSSNGVWLLNSKIGENHQYIKQTLNLASNKIFLLPSQGNTELTFFFHLIELNLSSNMLNLCSIERIARLLSLNPAW